MGHGTCAFHVCFFGASASWGIGKDCFHKAMLMNLHVDMSIYGVSLLCGSRFDFHRSTNIIEPISPIHFIFLLPRPCLGAIYLHISTNNSVED